MHDEEMARFERILRERKEFESERDRRLEERFREMRRRIEKVEDFQNKLIGLALGAPVVTAIIVYLLTRSSTGA